MRNGLFEVGDWVTWNRDGHEHRGAVASVRYGPAGGSLIVLGREDGQRQLRFVSASHATAVAWVVPRERPRINTPAGCRFCRILFTDRHGRQVESRCPQCGAFLREVA